ncbi:MAG: YihY/virulence factor BrkB family protein [Oscillospiraceae bacterium]|nr:YihY/virulence factor BrkB family protein [Oscillospiraceae bacterium]
MKFFSKGGPVDKGIEAFRWLSQFRVGLYAAHASFFMILSLFPGLVLILGLLRYAGLGGENLLALIEGFIPQVLLPTVRSIVRLTYQNTTGTVLSLSAAAALWSASRGIYSLVIGLNAIYGVKESRGYFRSRLVSMGYMFAFLIVLLLTLILHVFGNSLLRLLPGDTPFLRFLDEVLGLRSVLLLLLQTGLFSAMFMALPNEHCGFQDAFPGAVLSSLGWLTFSRLYSVYVEHFSGYAGIYGPVYTMAIGMLWLYFCISIVFYGGVFNRYLKLRKTSKEDK